MKMIILIILGMLGLVFAYGVSAIDIPEQYNFEDYKMVEKRNVILGAKKDHSCSWKPDGLNDGFKECSPELIIWNRKDVPITFEMIKNNFDFKITKAIRNNVDFYFSTNYEIYDYEKQNRTNPSLNYSVTGIRFTNWKEIDNKNKSIPANSVIGIRLNFELPQYKKASWNFTYKPLNFLLDPDIDACGTLIIEGGVYTLNQSITGVASNCIVIGNDSITFDMNGFNISGVTTKDNDGKGVRFSATRSLNDTTIANGTFFDFQQGIELVDISPAFFYRAKVLNVSIIAEGMNVTTDFGGAGAYSLSRIDGIILDNCRGCIMDDIKINLSQIGNTPNPPQTLGGGVRGIWLEGGQGFGTNITNILMEDLINKASVTDSEGILIDMGEQDHYFENITINGMGDFGSKGVKISGKNHRFKNINIVSTEYGAYLGGVGGALNVNYSFIDGIITGGLSDKDVFFDGFAPPFPPGLPKQSPRNTTFINVSFDTVGVVATGNPTWSRWWYYSALINNTNNAVLSGVDVVGYDNIQTLLFNKTTDANGLIPLQIIKEFNATVLNKQYWTPHTFNTTSSLCSDFGKSVNFTARGVIGSNLYKQPFEICSCHLSTNSISRVECKDSCVWNIPQVFAGDIILNDTGFLRLNNTLSNLTNNKMVFSQGCGLVLGEGGRIE